MKIIVCHGGSASDPQHQDGPQLACETGLAELNRGGSALDAAVLATQVLEDDERFNAGTGSNLRLDGTSIQMDASCMKSSGGFSAVAAIEKVKNPVLVAKVLLDTPHILLVGDGATAFARKRGFDEFDPTTSRAIERFKSLPDDKERMGEWTAETLARNWNFNTPPNKAFACDTVGCVVWDGNEFAGALSSGGTSAALRGRVGDVPLPGCGLYVGEYGAVAATGDGEYLAKAMLAYRAYLQLEQGFNPHQVLAWALGELSPGVDVGLIVANRTEYAGGARGGMAWSGNCM